MCRLDTRTQYVYAYNIIMSLPNRQLRSSRFCGVVVITSALHAEGHEFDPRQNLLVLSTNESVAAHIC